MNGLTVYSIGYSAWRIDELVAEVERLDATLIDTRHVPFSQWRPEWSKPNLQRRLGARYRHVAGFGNLRYREPSPDAILLADPEAALNEVEPLLACGPLLVMCACRDHETCHRREVTRLLAERYGVEVVLLAPKEADAAATRADQMRLF